MTFIRFLITWEGIEHAGPGLYDEEYLSYLYQVIKKTADYGIAVFIDPHQDVWSRFTGGDGAPGWTLEAVGLDLSKFTATGAAIRHQEHGDPYPRMIWPSNATKLATATLFTLFFGGDDFTPLTVVDNQPVQHFRIGPCPTPFQAMALGCGHAQTVAVFEYGAQGAQCIGETRIDPGGQIIWREGFPCVWQANGVWTDQDGTPRLLKPDHFSMVDGRQVDFERDYLKPFCLRFIRAIRQAQPKAIIFLENFPGLDCLKWGRDDPTQVVNATHWYDGRTLLTKQYTPPENRGSTGDASSGPDTLFEDQLGGIKQMVKEKMGGIPTLIGEFGLPFDMNGKEAYRTGDYTTHIQALNAYFTAIEHHMLNATLWNYTSDNDNEHGDQWNGEDLSIFSPDQQTDPADIHSGGRALQTVVRPYPKKIAGKPVLFSFDPDNRHFAVEFDPDDQATGPTEIFVPSYQYPDGYEVTLSAGIYEKDSAGQVLRIKHTALCRHRVEISPIIFNRYG